MTFTNQTQVGIQFLKYKYWNKTATEEEGGEVQFTYLKYP